MRVGARDRLRGSRRLSLAEDLRRVFGLDLLWGPRCGHQRRLIALIEQPAYLTASKAADTRGDPAPWTR